MAHVLFPLVLYLIGLALLLPSGPALPARFVAWTAFAWGALAWMVSSLLVLIAPVLFTPAMVAAALALICLARFLLFWPCLHWPSTAVLREAFLPSALFAIVITIPTVLQVVHVLPDSFHILIIAQDIADGGRSAATLTEFGVYGPGLPLLHSAASWLGVGFFYSLPAAITFTLVTTLRYFCIAGLQRLGWAGRSSTRLANLVTLLFVSTLWVFFQFTYFHNGSLAALFLLLGIGGLWLALVDGQKSWLWLGTLALLGLSLTRVETVLFSLAFLVLAVAYDRFSAKQWIGPLLAFTAVQLAWYGWLGLVAKPDTPYLTTTRIGLSAGLVALLFLGTLSLELNPLLRRIRPHLNSLALAGWSLVVVLLVAFHPGGLVDVLWSTAVNFLFFGTLWWGVLWWLVIVALLVLLGAPGFAYQRYFTGVVIAFITLYLLVGVVGGGYSMRADSSGSRMGLHILPVILLYLTLRAAPFLTERSAEPEPHL